MTNPYDIYKQALRHPKWRVVVIALTLFYLISPLDFIPELFVPLLGFVDDGLMLMILLQELFQIFLEGRKKYKEFKGQK
jgi:uncharacterized membrane protein YkvA (DUF1232 family)